MNVIGRRVLLKSGKLFDLVILVLSFGLASMPAVSATGAASFTDFFSVRVKLENIVLFAGLILAWHIVFRLSGLYEPRRFSARKTEVLDVVKATTVGTVIVCVATVLCSLKRGTPVFLATFWFISSVTLVSSRLAVRFILGQLRVRGRDLREIVMIGTNPRAIRFAQRIEANPALGYHILGFVDQEWSGLEAFRQTGYPLACDLEGFPGLLRERAIDEVVITLPVKSLYLQASRIVALAKEQGTVVRLLNNLFNLTMPGQKAEKLGDIGVITLLPNSAENWQHLIKRTLDLLVSLVSLIVLAPLFAVTALLVKLTSPGPVFFVQERVGLNKRRFRMFKFRTMVQDAERRIAEIEHLNEVSGPVFKIKNDSRVTSFGRILRATSIDELPQLFNALIGDMSLVGPRPLPVRDYNGFDQDWQRRRFSVRPGLTCLWQIHGRSSIPFNKWMDLDMEYIDRWSLGLDFMILAMTIPAVLRGSGAA